MCHYYFEVVLAQAFRVRRQALGLTAEHRGALIFDKAPLGVLSCTYICRCCNVYVHVCVHRWMDVCLQAHVLLFPYVRMYVGVCSNGCAHMNACVHTCMLVCVLTCVHTSYVTCETWMSERIKGCTRECLNKRINGRVGRCVHT